MCTFGKVKYTVPKSPEMLLIWMTCACLLASSLGSRPSGSAYNPAACHPTSVFASSSLLLSWGCRFVSPFPKGQKVISSWILFIFVALVNRASSENWFSSLRQHKKWSNRHERASALKHRWVIISYFYLLSYPCIDRGVFGSVNIIVCSATCQIYLFNNI